MTSLASSRRSTGTLMSDASGGAVSAAIWAGDLIWRAAAQPTAASSTTATKRGADFPCVACQLDRSPLRRTNLAHGR